MILQFILSMPNNNSWNGKWSGESNFYAIVHNFGRSKIRTTKAVEILKKEYYHYSFGDGWAAGITITEINAKEAVKIRRKSGGFCGYSWMVDSIIDHGEILNTKQREQLKKKPCKKD